MTPAPANHLAKRAPLARTCRVLVIDHQPEVHEQLRRVFHASQPGSGTAAAAVQNGEVRFELDSAMNGREGCQKLQQAVAAGSPYALAIVAALLPADWDGIETAKQIEKISPRLPIILGWTPAELSRADLTRRLGRSRQLVVLQKPFEPLETLPLAQALASRWAAEQETAQQLQAVQLKLQKEVNERLQMERALSLSEERFAKAFKASPIPLAIQSLQQEKFVDLNDGFQKITGYSREELIGHTADELKLWFDRNEKSAMLRRLREMMSVRHLPCRFRTKSGQPRDVVLSVELFELDGEPFLLVIAQDVTDQARLEVQLRQSQKMEAVGQLAAGVAHDFNNILTIVQGNASLLLNLKPPESKERKPLQTIVAASERASKLVRQLLTFSRKQFIQPRRLDIHETFGTVTELLPRVLGEQITLQILAPAGLPWINADPAMMEQMLMNLALNARDAMPEGGSVTLKAEAIELSREAAGQNPDALPGTYLCLSVTDTGCGMAPDILPRLFEPFFTTKGDGKNAGLGLATVYGIAKQHRGWVEVQSQLGHGSTFRVMIPVAAPETAETSPAVPVSEAPPGGQETILIAEDEQDLRDFVAEVLKAHGYNVVSANSGVQAIELWEQRSEPIHLLLTDLVMPGGVSGRQLAERLTRQDPNLIVIFTSGYSPGIAGKDLALLEGRNFLPKPYRPSKLLQMIRECLDQKPKAR